MLLPVREGRCEQNWHAKRGCSIPRGADIGQLSLLVQRHILGDRNLPKNSKIGPIPRVVSGNRGMQSIHQESIAVQHRRCCVLRPQGLNRTGVLSQGTLELNLT